MSTIAASLTIGQQVNLIHGIRPDSNSPFWELQRPGARLSIQPASVPLKGPVKLETSLVFCDSWSDLMAEFFSGYQIPACCCSSTTKNAAALVMQPGCEAAIQEAVAAQLGIPQQLAQDAADAAFALVCITKATARGSWTSSYAAVDEVTAALSKLPVQADPTQQLDVAPYMDAFQTVGTHFIREVQMGDVAMQAFVYTKDVLAVIRDAHCQAVASGSCAGPVQQVEFLRRYTSPPKLDDRGCTIARTRVATFSNSAAFHAQIAPKLADLQQGLPSSIFALLDSKSLISAFQELPDEVPIKITLAPLTGLLPSCTSGQPCVATSFCKVLEAALLQKFGHGATHSMGREEVLGRQPDYATMYKTTLPELVTTACTSVVAISQMYFRLNTIHKDKMLYASDTKEVQIFGDVVEVNSSMQLPGSQQVTLICRQLLAAPDEQGKPPVVMLASEEAFNSFQLAVEKAVGTMAVEGPPGSGLRRTLHQGVSLVTCPGLPDGPIDVMLEKTFGGTYLSPMHLASYSVQLGIQTTLLVAENALNYRFNEELAKAALAHAGWLQTSLAQVCGGAEHMDKMHCSEETKADLGKALARAALLLVVPMPGPKCCPVVPRLTYERYRDAIDEVAAVAQPFADVLKQSSVQIGVNKANEGAQQLPASSDQLTIGATGRLLLQQHELHKEMEEELWESSTPILRLQQEDIDAAIKANIDLMAEMAAQRQMLRKAGGCFVNGSRATMPAKSLSIYAAVEALAAVASEELDLEDTDADISKAAAQFPLVAKVDNLMQVAGLLAWLYHMTVSPLDASYETQDIPSVAHSADLLSVSCPSAFDWSDFDAEVSASMRQLPVASEWEGQALRVTSIARALSTSSFTLVKLLYGHLVQSWQAEVAAKQDARLEQFQTQLSQVDLPKQKAAEINLFELGTLMEARANRTTLSLLRTLSLQDAVLQYAYFQDPPQLNKASLLTIQDLHDLLLSHSSIARFSAEPLSTPAALPPIAIPFSYVLPSIPIANLLATGSHTFTIDTSNPAIPPSFTRVRLSHIELEFTRNRPTTSSGSLLATLTPDTTFSDRASDGSSHWYTAISPRTYSYAYNLTTGSTTLSNQLRNGSHNPYATLMTPFTRWTLAIPSADTKNSSLTFPPGALTTEVTVRFHCSTVHNIKPQQAPITTLLAAEPIATGPSILQQQSSGSSTSRASRAASWLNFDFSGQMAAIQAQMAAAAAYAKAAAEAAAAAIPTWTTNFSPSVALPWTDPESGLPYNAKMNLGPLVPSFTFSPDMSRLTIECAVAVGRLDPAQPLKADPSRPVEGALALPGGCFSFKGEFAGISDGNGGWGFRYGDPGSTKITLYQTADNWKSIKDPVSKQLKYADQNAVEAARQKLEQAVTQYYTATPSLVNVRVRVKAAQDQDMVRTMAGKSVMRGWDVICAMDADQISNLLKQKWQREQAAYNANPTQHNQDPNSSVFSIETKKTLLASLEDDDGNETNYYVQMSATLGPPLISFVGNQPGDCSFRIPILDATITHTNSSKPGVASTVRLDSSSAAVTGIVTLSLLKGVVDAADGVCIELGRAAFSTIADLPDPIPSTLGLAITTYFRENFPDKRIVLGGTKFRNYSNFDALNPRRFYMTTIRPDVSGPGVLLMFITTNGSDGPDRGGLDYLANPLKPGYSAALYVSSRILFQEMLLPVIRNGIPGVGDWCRAARDPDNNSSTYRIRGREGFQLHIQHLSATNIFNTERADGDVNVPLENVEIRTNGSEIETRFDVSFGVTVPECFMVCSSSRGTFSVRTNFRNLRPSVDPGSQTISMGSWERVGDPQIGSPDQNWYDGINKRKDLLNSARSNLSNRFQSVRATLPSVSVFAVSNLLFPNDQILDLREAYCPGDLLIVGNIKGQLSRSQHPQRTPEAPTPPSIAAEATPTSPAPPVELLSELSGHSAVHPWTLACALPTTHLNQQLAAAAFPTSLDLEPAIVNTGEGDDQVHVKLKLYLGTPIMQLLHPDDTRDQQPHVQLAVPVTGGAGVSVVCSVDGDMQPPQAVAIKEDGMLTLAVRLADGADWNVYKVFADLGSARVTGLDIFGKSMPQDTVAAIMAVLAKALQGTRQRLPLAELPTGDLPGLDRFAFAMAPHGSGAVVLAAGSSATMPAGHAAIGPSELASQPVPAGSRACMYISNKALMHDMLLPAVRKVGLVGSVFAPLAGAALQDPAAATDLTAITGGDTQIPIAGAISAPLSGLRIRAGGQATTPCDCLTVSWDQSWEQEVGPQPSTLLDTPTATFELSTARSAASSPLQLAAAADGSGKLVLQCPPLQLGAPIVRYSSQQGTGRLFDASQHVSQFVARNLQDALANLFIPGFSAGAPVLDLVGDLLQRLGSTGVALQPKVHVYVPGDLVLVLA